MSNLADVKVGDLLIKHFRGMRSVVNVDKLTPTQIVVTDGNRFRKKDGRGLNNLLKQIRV